MSDHGYTHVIRLQKHKKVKLFLLLLSSKGDMTDKTNSLLTLQISNLISPLGHLTVPFTSQKLSKK